MSNKDITTYAFIGADLRELYASLEKQSNTVILRDSGSRGFENMADAIQTIAHKNINVMLLAHGDKKQAAFVWHVKDAKAQGYAYDDLFAALPREGVQSIIVNTCYGGRAQNFLQHAPAGALVISVTGPDTTSLISHSKDFLRETTRLTNPIDLLVKALDNFDPKTFQEYMRAANKREHTTRDENPEHALPHIIGMGGTPPKILNLDEQIEGFRKATHSRKDLAAWDRSAERVKTLFDTKHHVITPGSDAQEGELKDQGPGGEAALKAKIGRIADRMLAGKPLEGKDEVERADNKRIAYALMATFLDESGTIARMRAAQIANEPKSLADALRNDTLMGTGQQNAPITREIEALGKAIGAKVSSDGVLTADEVKNIQAKLSLTPNGILDKATAEGILKKETQLGLIPVQPTPVLTGPQTPRVR